MRLTLPSALVALTVGPLAAAQSAVTGKKPWKYEHRPPEGIMPFRDVVSHLRQGDNLYPCSTAAIDVKTDHIEWHDQGTPNDGWDFDGVNEFITFDKDGKRIGAKADRNGSFYVLDAHDGKLENAFPFVRKVTWATGIDLKTGRPNFVPENRPGSAPRRPAITRFHSPVSAHAPANPTSGARRS